MPNELDPLIDQWYLYQGKGQRFFITAVNDVAKTIEVQHFDGDIEEFTFEEWRSLDIELSVEPENWAGALDIAEKDDFGTEITDTSMSDWNDPQKAFRDPSQEKLAPDPKSPDDDYGEGSMTEEPLE